MKAVGYRHSLPSADPQSLGDITADVPGPGPRDLRVAVKAVSVNPIDNAYADAVFSGNWGLGETVVAGIARATLSTT